MKLLQASAYLLIALVYPSTWALAQTGNGKMSIRDAIANPKLQPEMLSQGGWCGKTQTFAFVKRTGGPERIIQLKAGKDTAAVLRAAEIKEGDKPLTRFPKINWLDDNAFWYQSASGVKQVSISDKKIVKETSTPGEAENQDVHQGSLKVAYTIGNSLWIADGKTATEVAKSEKPGLVFGKSVHRNEFGISKGTFWSNKGDLLAYYAMDESMVTDYPLVELGSSPAKAKLIKYPMAGQKSHEVKLMIYNVNTGKSTVVVTEGDPEQYLTNITWSNDDKEIYIAIVNRDQNKCDLIAFDTQSGKYLRKVLTETSDTYTEPESGPIDLGTKGLVWTSERSGVNMLYLYNKEGKLIRSLTPPNEQLIQVYGVDVAGKYIYYQVAFNKGLDRGIRRTQIDNGKAESLSPTQEGIYNAGFSGDYSLMSLNESSYKTPNKVSIWKTGDKVPMRIMHEASNPLATLSLGKTDAVSLKAADGTELNGRVIYPPSFDANKKYPIVVYLYGGPHAQMVTNGWLRGSNLWMQYMAQNGYVVFTMDNRGSANRGQKFESATFRKLGVVESDDQMVGIKWLKSQAWADTGKIGIHGWSFGGFMTTRMMLNNPGTFKCGVAGGPVMDWKMYEIMYTERYMDKPDQNPDGYKEANLVDKASKLKDKLLLIHGTIDDVVVWQHSQEFVKKCVDEGVQLDYFIYPGHAHNVVGKDRVHLMDKVSRYFFDNLK